MERVSILTPAYNSMKTIFETIDSVLMQDYPEIEMIIADDHSAEFDEETIVAYIEAHKRQNIVNYQVYQNGENLGTVRNINDAIRRATGELLINLSADDLFYDEHTVSVIAAEFQRTGCDHLVTRRAAFVDDPQRILGLIPSDREINKIAKCKTPQEEYISLFIGKFYNRASGCVFCYTKDFIAGMGYFDEAYRLWEDGPFFSKLNLSGRMIHCNYDIISVRYRLGGMSTGNMPPMLHSDTAHFLLNGLESHNFKGFRRRIVKRKYYSLTSRHKRALTNIISLFKYPDVCCYLIFRRLFCNHG